jgi:hypothetical protein
LAFQRPSHALLFSTRAARVVVPKKYERKNDNQDCCIALITAPIHFGLDPFQFATQERTRQDSASRKTSINALPDDHLQQEHVWTPQNLTEVIPGFLPIPKDDYIKLYQANPQQLWPVECFIVPYRRVSAAHHNLLMLVRPSANGTSKWGLGTRSSDAMAFVDRRGAAGV